MSLQHQTPGSFQQQIEAYGASLSDAIPSGFSSPDSVQLKWPGSLISRASADANFRVQALRFIDVLPSLTDDNILTEHLQEYFAHTELPRLAEWGLKHAGSLWATHIAAPTVRYTLRSLARKFMGGNHLNDALHTLTRLRQQQINFTLDLLGEASISANECATYQQHYLDMLNHLAEPVANWEHNELLDTSFAQSSPRLNVSIKLSSLYSQIRSAAAADSVNEICKMLRPILRRAIEKNAFITIDMERYDFKHIVLGCFTQLIMEDEFITWPHIGLAMQAYLKDTYSDILTILALLKSRPAPVTIRLVRGAYWDYETVIARQNNWACPVWQSKNETDLNYENCLDLLLKSHSIVHTAIATHNPRSIAYAMALATQLQLRNDQFEFQMLYGMADDLKAALVNLHYRLRAYVPFGETLPGMAYLVRRLLENSSGQSLLNSGLNNQARSLCSADFQRICTPKTPLQLKAIDDSCFKNTPTLRFTDENERQQFKRSLQQIKPQLGRHYPLIIDNKEVFTTTTIQSTNPGNPGEIIGYVSAATHLHADMALESARRAFPQWSCTAVQQRADYLRCVANLLQNRRLEFSAWEIYEAGKTWQEADADICEAIDFLNYYADQAEKLLRGKNINVSGETNQLIYKARGVSLIIPPWNFPLAILCGMLSAAVVTGNSCILKPSSLTPVVSAKFMQLWQDVKLPAGVINFLPGSGKHIGEYLAQKPDIHIIAFTGSQEVGTRLLNLGAAIQPGQAHIKTVIAEMGGKNSIIIDSDADLDDAIVGVIQSAFGFQGQKCSAASRVIVVNNIYDKFVSRLIDATKSLKIGDSFEPENFAGPVIDSNAYKRILRIIDHAKETSRLHQPENHTHSHNGYFISPCIFTEVDPESPLAQEELFAPILSVLRAEDFFHAVRLANNTRYALTAGVYSRQPSHLDFARLNLQAGNIYLNRKTTGALVGRQPFGGFKMSGSGRKAGGGEYLLQFVDACCVSENTLRRGFAPDEDA